MSSESRAAKWMGAAICVLLLIVVATMERGVIGASIGQTLSILLMLIGVAWAVKGRDKLQRLSELYLWLAFILSMYHLQLLADGLAGWMGLDGIEVFRPVAILHVLVVGAALWALGAWSSDEEPAATSAYPARLAAGLFVVGAVVFWVGARTFPGMALEKIQANLAGHLWTSVNFLLANVITLAGLALFTLALREAGDRYFSALGLLFFTFGAVFWTLHLAFRLTVMVQAAQELNLTSGPSQWFEPWRDWAALLFGIYSVLAYIGLAAYGGALLKTGWLPRWVGWTCVVAGMLAAPLGGLPLFIHVPLWLVGILTLRQRKPWQQSAPSNETMEVFMPNSNVKAVESYINGLKNKDLSNVPFAPDVTFESPLTPKLFGKEKVVEFLSGLFPVIKDIRIKQHICEGDYVATVFDFDTSFGVIPVFDCFRVSDGLLKEIRPYYDPRPITEAMK